MKLILAIIKPEKLETVKEALSKIAVFRLTVIDVQGFGRQKGQSQIYRGHELTVNMMRKVQLQIAVNEDFVEPTVNAIMEAAHWPRRSHRRWENLHLATGRLRSDPHERTRPRSDLIASTVHGISNSS